MPAVRRATRIPRSLAGAAVAVALASGLLLACSSTNSGAGTPPATTSTTPASGGLVFVSPDGNDSSCARYAARPASPKPCATFARAYLVAEPGDTVEIAAGTYPDQEIDADPRKQGSTQMVTFQPAAGASVTVDGYLRLGADPAQSEGHPAPSYVTISGLAVTTRAEAYTPGQHIVWNDIDGGAFYIRGVQHMLIEGGDWGPCWSDNEPSSDHPCNENTKIEGGGGSEQLTTDVVIDHAVFHDFTLTENHFECMIIDGGTGITVERSTFRNCQIYDIDISNDGPGIGSLLLTRNWFGEPSGGTGPVQWAVNFSSGNYPQPLTNITVESNSFLDGAGMTWSSGTIGSVQASRNIFGYSDCLPNVNYVDNFWEQRPACGDSSNLTAPPYGYVLADGALQPDPSVAPALHQAFLDALAGKTPAELARQLRSEHVHPPSGTRSWSAKAIVDVLTNPIYVGGRYGAPGAHAAIFGRRAWLRLCRQLACATGG